MFGGSSSWDKAIFLKGCMVQLVEMIYQSSSCLSLCLISLILILGRGDSKAQRLAFQPKMPHIHHFATCFLHFFWYLPSKSNTSPFFSLDVLVVLLYPGKSDTSHHFTPFFPAQEPASPTRMAVHQQFRCCGHKAPRCDRQHVENGDF